MKHIIISMLVGVYTLPILSYAHNNEQENYSFSVDTKNTLIQRLEPFFDRVDSYQEEKTQATYITLQNKISTLQTEYSQDSLHYELLDLVGEIVNHKLEEDSSYTNQEILAHILFGESLSMIEKAQKIQEDFIQEPEKEIIYRADLDTRDLNEYEKNIVAGESGGVISVEVRANLEEIETETVYFQFNQDIDNIGLEGNLYYNGVFIAHSGPSATDDNILEFTNITDLVIEKTTGYLQLELLPAKIGKDEVGQAKENLIITRTVLSENTGTITGDKLGDRTLNDDSPAFNIVPADILIDVEQEFGNNTSTAIFNIHPLAGKNNDDGAEITVEIREIELTVSAFQDSGEVFIFNQQGDQIGSTIITSAGINNIILSPDRVSQNGETYRIESSVEGIFRLSQDAIVYRAGNDNYTSQFSSQIDLGQQ